MRKGRKMEKKDPCAGMRIVMNTSMMPGRQGQYIRLRQKVDDLFWRVWSRGGGGQSGECT
jgi:hypothetical protein